MQYPCTHPPRGVSKEQLFLVLHASIGGFPGLHWGPPKLPDGVDAEALLKPQNFSFLIRQLMSGWLMEAVTTYPRDYATIVLRSTAREKNARACRGIIHFDAESGEKKILWYRWRKDDGGAEYGKMCDMMREKYHLTVRDVKLREGDLVKNQTFPQEFLLKVSFLLSFLSFPSVPALPPSPCLQVIPPTM